MPSGFHQRANPVNNFPYVHPNDITEEHIADALRQFEKCGYPKPSHGVMAIVLADAQNRVVQKINDTSGLRK